MNLLRICLLALCTTALSAQYQVSGTVRDGAGEPLSFANAVLYDASDSTFVAGTTTDLDGQFVLAVSAAGSYYLLGSQIGLADYRSASFPLNKDNPSRTFPALTLDASGGVDLEAVTVTATKPLFTREIDRTIVNVADQPSTAGQTALEVLERSPGVIVDRVGGGINMLGKDGVRVMINGRLNYMPADALLSYLAGIPASNILRLELITTPPADLDAEGNAGYIDIVLRRLPDEGLRGTYALTGGYGGGEVVQGSLNLTYRRGGVSVFSNLSYARNAIPEASYLRRTISGENPETTDLFFDRDPLRTTVNARLGTDFTLGAKTTLGVLLSGYTDRYDMTGLQTNRFGLATVPDTLLRTEVVEDNNWLHGQAGLSLTRQLGKGGSLSGGVDYLYYTNDNPIGYALDYGPLEGGPSFRTQSLNSSKESPFGILVGKVDYSQPLAGGTFTLGAKAVLADFENDVRLLRDGRLDPGFSSLSTLDERIGAAYAQYRGATGGDGGRGVEYQFGLRYELTDTELDEATEGRLVDRNYGLLFPNASLGFRIGELTKLTAGYSRRIDRPAFTQLAPFVVFLDPRTNFGGNPALQPGIANAIEVGITRSGLSLNLGYTTIDSAIAAFQPIYDAELRAQVIQPINLSDQRIYSANLGVPTNIAPWWKGRLNATYTHTENTTFIEGTSVTTRLGNFRIAGGQNFSLPGNWTLGLSGFYSGRNLRGYVEALPLGTLNVALQKKLGNGASLTLGVDDALNTFEFRNETSIPAQRFYAERGYDPSRPTFKLSYSASFGNGRVKQVNRDSAAEERGRVQ
jgi:hypothetical protein